MGNVYSEERFDEEARTLIVGQTAADLQALVEVDYCRDLWRTLADLLHSVSFPAHFEFKGKRMKAGIASEHVIAGYYLKIAQCLSACLRATCPKYLDGQLMPWQEFKGKGKMFQEDDVDYFFKDQYDLATGTYKKRKPLLDDEEQWKAAFEKRAELFRAFSELLKFPQNPKIENFRKLMVEFEPFEKWLDLHLEKLQFHLTTNRIRSLLKI